MIKSEKNERLFRMGSVLVFTLLLILGLAVSFDTYYDLNDDTVIKDIISGTYTGTPSGYSIQMLYPLSWLLAVLYTAIPGIAWYGLFLCLCQFCALAIIAWRLVGITGNRKLQIGLLVIEAIVVVGMLLRNFVFVQYSVTSGICMAAAIFWYITGEKEKNWLKTIKQNIVALILVWIAFCIRTELCIMLLPFLLLAGIAKWLSEEKIFTFENMKKYILLIMTALAGMLLLYVIDTGAYSSAEWKEFRAFFNARTDLYDFYEIPDYDVNQEFYQEIGLTRESYTLLQNYNFSLDEEIHTGMMQEIVGYQKEHGQNLYSVGGFTCKNSLRKALWLYKEHLLRQTSYLIIAVYLLFFFLSFSRRKSGCYWKLLLLFGIRSIVWMYLFMVDRTPERITTPLVFTEVLVLIGWLIQEFRVQGVITAVTEEGQRKLLYMKQVGSILVLVLCGVVILMINVKQTGQEYKNRGEANKRWEALITYCMEHQDSFYSVDVYSSTSYQGAIYSEKIFNAVDNSYRNFDICGGWAAKSPLMYEKLEKSGVTRLEASFLAEEDNTFFVAACDKNVSWLIDYYRVKGYEIQVEIMDTIYAENQEAFYVYQLKAVN